MYLSHFQQTGKVASSTLYYKLNTTKSRHRKIIWCISSILDLFIGIYSTSMQASDTCYCSIQMTMSKEDKLLAQAHVSLFIDECVPFLISQIFFRFHLSFILWLCFSMWGRHGSQSSNSLRGFYWWCSDWLKLPQSPLFCLEFHLRNSERLLSEFVRLCVRSGGVLQSNR